MKSSLPSVPARITIKENKIDNIQNYDIDNNYPGRISDIIKASGTASLCVDRYSKFINGKGFKDLGFYKSRINRKGMTVDALLRETSKDFAKYRGFAIHVNYNALFQVNEVFHVPFDHCRLCLSDSKGYVSKIAVYCNWDGKKGKIEKDKIDYINIWNPDPDVVGAQMEAVGGIENYSGQIMWYSFEGESYPLSIVDPVIEDVVSDRGVKKFRLRSTTTSFLPSHAIEYPYAFEDDDERTEEVDKWKKFQGVDESNKLVIIENPDMDEKKTLKIHKIDWQNTDKIYETTNRTVKESIIESFGIPPVLANIQTPGKLGTAQEMKDAYLIYNSVTYDERRIKEEKYREIFSRYRNPINVTGDYSIIPLSFDLPVQPATV